MLPLHASAFAYEGVGCLVLGESGSGKSRIVADALLLGATLIADDRVQLANDQGTLTASPVPQLRGVLELRGLGLISVASWLDAHPLHFALTLDAAVNERLPELQILTYFGIAIPHLRVAPPPISALLLYLKAMREGRILPPDWHPLG